MSPDDGDALCEAYLETCQSILRRIHREEAFALSRGAARIADQIAADRLVHIYGPGGHSNLAAQELFYRAGGSMHISPILDEGTLLSNGALRSTAMERLPGYGTLVIEQAGLGAGDVLVLVNAFGVNAAVIDAAQTAAERGVFLIGLNAHATARAIPRDHPARHPSGVNLQDLVDVAIDSKVPDGDAVLTLPGTDLSVGPVSTFANGYALNTLMLRTIALLRARGHTPALWQSRNASTGDRNDAAAIAELQRRVACL